MFSAERDAGSFRDSAAFIVRTPDRILRCLRPSYIQHYTHIIQSGLYARLVGSQLLIPHEEVTDVVVDGHAVIQPQMVPFIAYPYELTFSQLKAAAIATLTVQRIALEYDMGLKDASAYNIQFVDGKPLLIDTSSLKKYNEGEPWVAYGQFCNHFLAPLALMCYTDVRLNKLMEVFLDGIPLDLAASILPWHARLNMGLAYHLFIHASMQKSVGRPAKPGSGTKRVVKLDKQAVIGLVDQLQGIVEKLELPGLDSHWSRYYKENNYSDADFEYKKNLVSSYLDIVKPKKVFDLGANTGVFSRIAAGKDMFVVSLDLDPICAELNYRECLKTSEKRIMPLVMDLTNPSPSLGFACRERQSIIERGPADTVMALALIHHLVIANNIPMDLVAGFMADLCKSLIIEFVHKEDSQVQRLLASRDSTFDDYTQENFELAFGKFFVVEKCEAVAGNNRHLYLMKTKGYLAD